MIDVCQLIMVILIFFFSIPYIFVLIWSPKEDGIKEDGIKENGIWKIWFPDRVRDEIGSDKPEPLPKGFFSALTYGFYFSLLSAFSIGFKELNVRNWITRLQREEYTLRATGWVKTVSGFQSLISVYLLALWVLAYFGRAFESF